MRRLPPSLLIVSARFRAGVRTALARRCSFVEGTAHVRRKRSAGKLNRLAEAAQWNEVDRNNVVRLLTDRYRSGENLKMVPTPRTTGLGPATSEMVTVPPLRSKATIHQDDLAVESDRGIGNKRSHWEKVLRPCAYNSDSSLARSSPKVSFRVAPIESGMQGPLTGPSGTSYAEAIERRRGELTWWRKTDLTRFNGQNTVGL